MRLLTRAVLALGLICAVVPGVRPAEASGEVPWLTDVGRASDLSRETNQPMLLEFWATWCAACKAMDEQVFNEPRVVEAMGRLTPVRIDIDRQARVARRYQVDATPTLIVTDSYGRELFRYAGALGVDAVLGLLADLPQDVTELNRLGNRVARDGNDLDALEALGRALRGAGFYQASTTCLERALRTRAARRGGAARRATILMTIADNHTAVQDPEAADRARRRAHELTGSPGNERK